jgi:hypothetical protein
LLLASRNLLDQGIEHHLHLSARAPTRDLFEKLLSVDGIRSHWNKILERPVLEMPGAARQPSGVSLPV